MGLCCPIPPIEILEASAPEDSLSRSDVLAIVGTLVGLTPPMFESWVTKSLLLGAAILLILYWALRHRVHPIWRIDIGAGLICFFVYGYWRPIWDDFHEKHPKIVWGWWRPLDFKSSIPRHAFVHKPADRRPTPPPVATVPPAPKPSAPPWVTQDEIDAQRKIGRPLLNYSPAELLTLWEGNQSISAYLGKWIKIDYPFSALLVEVIDKKKYYVVQMNIESVSFTSGIFWRISMKRNGSLD